MGKLSTVERKKFVYEKLEEQRHLLRKSVNEIIAGDLTEALRVATTIRVLILETGSSTALLKQLDPNYLQLEILDRDETPPPEASGPPLFRIPISLQISAQGVFLSGKMPEETHVRSPLGHWWERPDVLVLSNLGGFTRKEVILGLANKEGGAHVDPDISKKYHKLMEYKSVPVGNSKENLTPLKLSRLFAGQSGLELLWYLEKHSRSVCETGVPMS